MSKKINDDEVQQLQRSLVTAAKAVDRYGVTYLPIFKRVEQDLEKAKGDEDVLARVRKLAA